ncbi:hypothetical protein ABIC22_004690 [Paenibacillus sp. PvP094]|uniref:hypothetical protein n=1 Tax=Paenibacillus sp. PvP094 TaxID=3156394 RepID=UPI0033910AF8
MIYQPLCIDRSSGSLILIKDEGSLIRLQDFVNLDTFLLNFVFGKKYDEIVSNVEKEEWFQFLEKMKLYKGSLLAYDSMIQQNVQLENHGF